LKNTQNQILEESESKSLKMRFIEK
jgi:hypothetical protein